MNTATSRLAIIGSLFSSVLLAGCVSQGAYDALQSQNQQLQAQLTESRQRVSQLQEAIKYTVESDMLFAPGSWKLNPRGAHFISDMVHKLAPTQRDTLTVTGYTDNAPVGPGLRQAGITSNEALSQKRADAVRDYIISQGANPKLVVAKGMGDQNPVAPNDNEKGRAQNRRVEFSLTPATG